MSNFLVTIRYLVAAYAGAVTALAGSSMVGEQACAPCPEEVVVPAPAQPEGPVAPEAAPEAVPAEPVAAPVEVPVAVTQ